MSQVVTTEVAATRAHPRTWVLWVFRAICSARAMIQNRTLPAGPISQPRWPRPRLRLSPR